MSYFKFNKATGDVELDNPALLGVKEFKALLDLARNKTKTDKTGKNQELAQKELNFIAKYFDWNSPYFKFLEQDKYEAALSDSGLTEKELQDPLFKDACKKFEELINGILELRLLKSSMNAVEKIIKYLDDVDINERDPQTGKPLLKAKDVIAEIKGAKDLIQTIRELEENVKLSLQAEDELRGGEQPGLFDYGGM